MFRTYVLTVRRAELYYTASGIITLKQKYQKFTHTFYYHVLILIELYFNNFNFFSNFRLFTYFSVMIPETV